MNWVRHLTSDLGNSKLNKVREGYGFPFTTRDTEKLLLYSEVSFCMYGNIYGPTLNLSCFVVIQNIATVVDRMDNAIDF